MDSSAEISARAEALQAARGISEGRIGIIEGCRRLSSLAHQVVPDWTLDEDFRVFGAVSSETDCLPTGSARRYWENSALEREDQKISAAEALYREAVLSACRNVIARFEAE